MVATPEPTTFVEWHDLALYFAVECNKVSKAKYDAAPDDIVRAALLVLHHDAVITHRAIGELTTAGWSSSAAALVRTLFDISVSVLAVLNSSDRKFAAFKYFYSNYRETARDQTYDAAFRREMREVIRSRIRSLSAPDQPAALSFLKLKDHPS